MPGESHVKEHKDHSLELYDQEDMPGKAHAKEDNEDVSVEPVVKNEPAWDITEEKSSTNLEQKPMSESADVEAGSTYGRAAQDSIEEQGHGKDEGSYRRDSGSSKDDKPQEGDHVSESTVEGDQPGLEGDYEFPIELCTEPETCSCPSCANINLDTDTTASQVDQNEALSEHARANIIPNPDNAGLNQSDSAPNQSHISGAIDEESLQETVSSQTVEPENEYLEDLFHQDNDQTLDNGRDGLTDSHPDNMENFELEDDHQDEDSLVDRGFGNTHTHQAESEEQTIEHGMVPQQLTSDCKSSPINQIHVKSQDVHQLEGEDEFLDFDGDEEADDEVDGDEEETSMPAGLPEEQSNDTNTIDTVDPLDKQHDPSDNGSFPTKVVTGGSQSPPAKQNGDRLIQREEDVPTEPSTPRSGKNGSKRKALEDNDDEFDLFSSETPDKKRRRPS